MTDFEQDQPGPEAGQHGPAAEPEPPATYEPEPPAAYEPKSSAASEQTNPAAFGPENAPAGPESPAAGPDSSSAAPANPYQDFWDSWDEPPVTVATPWAAPSPPASQPAGTGYHGAGLPPRADYWPSGGYYGGGYPATTSFMPYQPPASRRRRPWILGVAAAVLLLLFGGGGLVAYQALNGGGVQPEQVLPADAVAFYKIDLNPSASQKIDAARLLHRLPQLGGLTGSGDWRRQLFQALLQDGELPDGISYDRDLKPWLGERAAVAVLPQQSGAADVPVLVLQCSDAGKARTALANFNVVGGLSFYRGYAVLAPSQAIADQAVTGAKSLSLAADPDYRADFRQLGGSGIAAGWADLGALGPLAGGQAGSGLAGTGRIAFIVRVTSNAIELVGRANGLAGNSQPAADSDLGSLPANTAVAAEAGLDPAAIDRSWQQYSRLLEGSGTLFGLPGTATTSDAPGSLLSFEQEWGLRLPSDLTTVLGTGLTVSVAGPGISGGAAKFAVRTHSNGAAAAAVLDRIRRAVQAHGTDFPLTYRVTPTGLLAGDDAGYLDSLGNPGTATLAGLKSFRSALPEASGATEAVFVNLDAIAADLRAHSGDPDTLQALSAFSAAGLSVHYGGGSASLHVRLVAR